jgi:carboxymethylenebutenolidase
MRQEIIDLYDAYTHTPLERRVFLQQLAALAGGTTAAAALLPLLEASAASAAMVAANDARLRVAHITYPAASGDMRGYLARPKEVTGKLPALIVIHENRGLNAHIEDVTRRAALDGFLALAPDMLSAVGGTPPDEDKARDMIRQLDRQATLKNLQATLAYLKQHPDCTGKVGSVGFCWGGGMSNELAVSAPMLDAAVVFYGQSPAPGTVASIQAPLLLHYAGLDERINATVPAYEEALKAAGKRYMLYMYENVNHAFHNDTSEARYNADAAQLAWKRTMAFFQQHLKG